MSRTEVLILSGYAAFALLMIWRAFSIARQNRKTREINQRLREIERVTAGLSSHLEKLNQGIQ